ncbi:MAG: HPr family phosphocarrier protein [Clostridiales bacterium]|nr:HPr family phosphocarrier protein [Clostridiales bacterium]
MQQSIVIKTSSELSKFMHLAWESEYEIGVHDHKGAIADAKSVLGLLALDFHEPVLVVTDDDKFIKKIESALGL